MAFNSLNGVNAAKGLQGTSRQANATFSGLSGPIQGPPQGMAAPQGPVAQAAPVGSSYSLGGGMQGTGRTLGLTKADAGPLRSLTGGENTPDANGVISGKQQAMANVGQVGPQLTQAQMQDPENAAMAGFQFAQSQDRPVEASAPVDYSTPPPPPSPQTGNYSAPPKGSGATGGGYQQQGGLMGPAGAGGAPGTAFNPPSMVGSGAPKSMGQPMRQQGPTPGGGVSNQDDFIRSGFGR